MISQGSHTRPEPERVRPTQLARPAAERSRKGLDRHALGLTVFLLVLLLPLAAPLGRAAAQTTEPLTVTVDREDVTTDDVLSLEIVVAVDAGTSPSPILPSFENFDVLSSSTASQLNIVGGQQRSRVTYQYELQPQRFGVLVIEPVRLEWEGKTYASPPL